VTAYEPRFDSVAEVSSYHGYWIKDWFRLNPHFTDHGARDFSMIHELLNAAKTRGIRIYLDTVVNHSSPIQPSDWSLRRLESVAPIGTENGRSYRGVVFEDGRYLTSYSEDRNRARNEQGYRSRFHQYERNIGDVNGSYDWNNPFIVETHNLVGLADIDQSSEVMSDYFRRAHDFWMERFPDLAGFRMDTIKHVSNRYWDYFSEHIYSKFPNIEILGEYFGGGTSNALSREFYQNTDMTMLDFDFRDAVVDVFLRDQPFRRISDVWSRDHLVGDASGLVTYLDSHDHPRLRGEGLSYERMRLAIVLWLTSRGIPCIYQGLEQDQYVPNDPGDPYNRPMMSSFDTNHELYRLIGTLVQLRYRNQALRYGQTHVVHETDQLFSFERVDGEQKVYVAMSKNRRVGPDVFRMNGLSFNDGGYRDLISGRVWDVRNGGIDVSLAYGDVIVLSTH
jgi:cyclomaltodextrin glucanotransferase